MEIQMEKLTDFRPIEKLTLPKLGDLTCSGLTVVVGPNSSGKSQLLRDIKERISGEPRELVVAEQLELASLDHKTFLKCLKVEGYISSIWDNNDQEQYIPMTTAIGTGQGAQNVGTQQLEQWQNRSANAIRRKRRDEYFGWFSRFLVTGLFLENRLTSMSAANTIDFETQPPSHDLHALHLNDPARKALTEEIQRAFSKAIWSDISRGNQLCLRIGEEGKIPTADDRLSVKEMAKYRTLASEGDGMKSYVATVISLLLGRRPVSVIDEPEMCLHPPQAYNLGQFIGSSGTSEQTATFVATHSSHILRGVLQTASKLQIVRMTRNPSGFSAKHVDSNLLSEAMRKPTVRAETVLDGIFAQAVTIIEADGDRVVYQAAWEVVGQRRNFDIHFTAAGGTGGIADTCQ
ncbi:MAG: AAA family ATPase, partial [Candidatus Thiodiazotropha endolucinida]